MITIPKKFYVGRQWRPNEPTPLGFMTPMDSTKAFEKRKATVDNWAAARYYGVSDKPVLDAIDVDNELLTGFRICESVKRTGWNGGNVVWRMEDPRGFQFEISSGNMAALLGCTTITAGVIHDRCLFGRDGSTNVLLPEGSEPYLASLQTQERVDSPKLKKGEFAIGDILQLESGDEVWYLGEYTVVGQKHKRVSIERNNDSYQYTVKPVRNHAYVMKHKGEFNMALLDLRSSPHKTVAVTGHKAIKQDDVIAAILKSGNSYRRTLYFITPDKIKPSEVTMTREVIKPTFTPAVQYHGHKPVDKFDEDVFVDYQGYPIHISKNTWRNHVSVPTHTTHKPVTVDLNEKSVTVQSYSWRTYHRDWDDVVSKSGEPFALFIHYKNQKIRMEF